MARSSHLNVMFARAEKVKFLNLFFPNNFFSSLGKGAKNTHSPHKNHLLFSAREREFTRDTSRAFSLPPLENERTMMSLPNMPGMTSMGATTWSQQVK